ncbi:MAG TPA: hypothetical protein VGG34_08550 [Opitutaceae bacterium]|jgi:hypothetical protein
MPDPKERADETPITWPDAAGELHVSIKGSGFTQPSVARNPWLPEQAKEAKSRSFRVYCGAVIVGKARGQAAALIDGRILRENDTLKDFRIAEITGKGAVIEINGARFGLPVRRETSIEEREE